MNDFRSHIGKPHYNYSYESRFANKSSRYDLNSSLGLGLSELEGGRIAFVNGIKTERSTLEAHGRYLSNMAGANIYGVHNETHGLWNDLGEAREGLYKNTLTAPAFELQKFVGDYFLKNGLDKELLLLSHNQGAIITKNALPGIPEEMRRQISVLAIAPGAYIPDGSCKDIRHVVSSRDIVPLFDLRGRRRCQDSITVLKPHKNAPLWDHDFQSPTYEKAIQDRIDEFKRSVGEK